MILLQSHRCNPNHQNRTDGPPLPAALRWSPRHFFFLGGVALFSNGTSSARTGGGWIMTLSAIIFMLQLTRAASANFKLEEQAEADLEDQDDVDET